MAFVSQDGKQVPDSDTLDWHKPKTKEQRRAETARQPKCWCGNVARQGSKFCGRHEPEELPERFTSLEDDKAALMREFRVKAQRLEELIDAYRAFYGRLPWEKEDAE